MKITNLHIENFKATSSLHLENLGDSVVIAGPNGCGKSCILDAIRLLKSLYGGYHQQNEWNQWFGEFQLDMRDMGSSISNLQRDKTTPIVVSASIILTETEIEYIKSEGRKLLYFISWRSSTNQSISLLGNNNNGIDSTNPAFHQQIDSLYENLIREIQGQTFTASFRADPSMGIVRDPSILLEVIFSSYIPNKIGIIDFHGANRNYSREQFSGVNLSLKDFASNSSQHALYNSANKYNNVKSELASAYVKDLISREASETKTSAVSLNSTLHELFNTFFSGKQFIGPAPTENGSLSFDVRLDNGITHDLNDLSSGEKEVLYGYLRLKNSAPQNSVVLLDEPELHLNPRLIRGLASFYRKNLGEALNNQLWLITHSDTLLRDTVEDPEFSVFHLQAADNIILSGNQAHLLSASADAERVIIELVGDLSTYTPNGKLVIFEGGGDSDFDVKMVRTLFPDFSKSVNAVSGGNKSRVRDLHSALEAAAKAGNLPIRFFSVVDRDSEKSTPSTNGNTSQSFTWDVYHIENYLLESKYICRAVQDLRLSENHSSEEEVERNLLSSARQVVNLLVHTQLQDIINDKLVGCINIGANPNSSTQSIELHNSVSNSQRRLDSVLSNDLLPSKIQEMEKTIRDEFETALLDGTWKKTFRGRDVLKRFAGLLSDGIKYEQLRNLIIARMRDDGYQPQGMVDVVNAIINA